MRVLIAGAASLALAASMASAQPDRGKGNQGGGKPAAAGKAKSTGGGAGNKPATRGNGNGWGNAKAQTQRGPDRAKPSQQRAGNGNGNGNGNAAVRGNAKANGNSGRANGAGPAKDVTRDIRRVAERAGSDTRYIRTDRGGGYYEGCPPGLAKKYNGCQPPGLAKKRQGGNRFYDRPSLFGLGGLGSGSYFYGDGFLLRLDGGGNISGYIPLLGGALAIGNPWPDYYRSSTVPDYYRSYYDLGRPDRYRYADNVIYRVDAETAAIQSVAALLTGDDFVVGQTMPRGYSVYNVPYQYRDRYRDRPGANYRYADGYIYQVDPETQLIAAAIDLVL